MINKQHIRLIFGLKLKQLRLDKGLSFAQLGKASGLSVSYLNEIEKGKKYPKSDKIIALAQALDVSYDQLVSIKLSKKLAPVADLLRSGFLDSLPLDLFGLETSNLLELISGAPAKINAFISTVIKIARNYEMSQEHFYFAALRSFQEMHDNYFEDLEAAVEAFVAEYELDTQPPVKREALEDILTGSFHYTIDRESLKHHSELEKFRSVFIPKTRTLCINDRLSAIQQSFQLGKEIAYNYLHMTERPTTSSLFRVHSFEEVLNNFKASYFSVSLLLNRQYMLEDLHQLFKMPSWNSEAFFELLEKYAASPEMFLHRLSNLLPKYFGIDTFFFLRFNHDLLEEEHNFHITKELHISRLHNPHRNDLQKHYCRRWVSIRILQNLKALQDTGKAPGLLVDTQISQYIGTKNEYFCLSIASPNSPTPNTNVSVTLGIQLDEASRKLLRFLGDASIPVKEVNQTCETCPLMDCSERAAPPTIIRQRQQQRNIQKKLEELANPDLSVTMS